jgi:hypothetical protein
LNEGDRLVGGDSSFEVCRVEGEARSPSFNRRLGGALKVDDCVAIRVRRFVVSDFVID